MPSVARALSNGPARSVGGTILIAMLLLRGCGGLPDATRDLPPSRTADPTATQVTSAASADPVWDPLRRPLLLPAMSADFQCPRATGSQVVEGLAPALGEGPVYPVGFSRDGRLDLTQGEIVDGTVYWKTLWTSAPNYAGPVLIRGGRIDGEGPVSFGDGDRRGLEELRLPVQGWAYSDGVDPSWRQWPSTTGVPTTGCYAYQIDGTDFTVHIVFQIV